MKNFRCAAEHYADDKPHLWTVEGGIEKYVWATDAKVRSIKTVRTCREHRRPADITPTILAANLSVASFAACAVEAEKWPGMPDAIVVAMSSDDGVAIKFRFNQEEESISSRSSRASGHTSFTSSQGVRTFDRTGVDDSFQIGYQDDLSDISAKIEDQLRKVRESRARIDDSVPVPGIGFLVTPERRAEVSGRLKKGSSYSFTPSGFGTGYLLYVGRARSRYDKRASGEMEAFFDIAPIWLQLVDCD